MIITVIITVTSTPRETRDGKDTCLEPPRPLQPPGMLIVSIAPSLRVVKCVRFGILWVYHVSYLFIFPVFFVPLVERIDGRVVSRENADKGDDDSRVTCQVTNFSVTRQTTHLAHQLVHASFFICWRTHHRRLGNRNCVIFQGVRSAWVAESGRSHVEPTAARPRSRVGLD